LETIKHNAGIMDKTLLQSCREKLECVEIYIHPLFSALFTLSGSLFISLPGVEGNRVGRWRTGRDLEGSSRGSVDIVSGYNHFREIRPTRNKNEETQSGQSVGVPCEILNDS
jgi:hypothetical protein